MILTVNFRLDGSDRKLCDAVIPPNSYLNIGTYKSVFCSFLKILNLYICSYHANAQEVEMHMHQQWCYLITYLAIHGMQKLC
jgi:hypothetical protein